MPKTILLFSGKRKSGKDYITDHLKLNLGEAKCDVLKISQPIKSYWAEKNGLSLKELLGANEYKESHRLAMITWSEAVRARDYGYFCNIVCQKAEDKLIWIVSDIRRQTDIKWFRENYPGLVKTVNITADEETRRKRGFVFTAGVDDAESECDLDGVTDWDLVLDNGTSQGIKLQMKKIFELIDSV